MAEQIKTALTILRRKQVESATGLSKTTIYARIREKTFPAPVRLGVRSVGWRAGDIDEFLISPSTYRAEDAQ
jgi:prophage regulatory protein